MRAMRVVHFCAALASVALSAIRAEGQNLTEFQRKAYKTQVEYNELVVDPQKFDGQKVKLFVEFKSPRREHLHGFWPKCLPYDDYGYMETVPCGVVPIVFRKQKGDKPLVDKIVALAPGTKITIFGTVKDVGGKVPKKHRSPSFPGYYVLMDGFVEGQEAAAAEPKAAAKAAKDAEDGKDGRRVAAAPTAKFDPSKYKVVKAEALDLTRDSYVDKRIKLSIPYAGRAAALDPCLGMDPEECFMLNTPKNAGLDDFLIVGRRKDSASVEAILNMSEGDPAVLFGELRKLSDGKFCIIADRIQKGGEKKEESLEDLMMQLAD